MKNIDIIMNNSMYTESLEKLKKYEENREFCNHTIEHFIDVARIAYIMVLEEDLKVSKEVIYAIGLLHDIGRVKQYEEGIHHDIASVDMSREILKETSFTEEEVKIILNGIANHRKESDNKLEEIIYRADKLSRQCFSCKAENECYWSKDKKNFKITY
ncbi:MULTISPECIES: HD domain-containing protein [unclassified Clostridium]|uniref:HD domain-containing protein n=1 Tax=Clostridium TaxID=1485 RepID=UPI001C8BE660|nr:MULTISPECIES: HD domain-containing protein [unclassified Clostridium]MBX9136613.1 HD domain-containing protein [Clostridium sp. K12(2020)]MBX9144807.1 HD domain-containing protein [Clostridium sp. K13]MDU2288881.1 HD domain-containing protein [Clostridium celatum]MDU4324767.1 HD domain-containing protein [Clostridium celatum]